MKKKIHSSLILFFISSFSIAQNPLVMKEFTADPTTRVFEDKVYIYPSHDIDCGTDWFCMKDYHVYSSENLVDWIDHGVILSQENVEWVDTTLNAMWAPDCYEKDGKYYFYFPARLDDSRSGNKIGVAVSERPFGPFNPEPNPIQGTFGIDPNVFIDKDGQAYIYWASHRTLYAAKLKENMLELDSEPAEVEIHSVPEGFKEGPFLFERNGIYYFTFPLVIEETEAIVYGTGNNPIGPFEYKGIIMDEHSSGCWTNHHSIVNYREQWYLFYHHNDLSPDFDKLRSIRCDSLFFNYDGTIQKVTPTFRGVGITKAENQIHLDRFSAISENDTEIDFIDEDDRQNGWRVILKSDKAWVQYNSVDFGNYNLKKIKVNALTDSSGEVEIYADKKDGPLIAKFKIGQNDSWTITKENIEYSPEGIHNIFLKSAMDSEVQIDWISFE